MAMMAQITAQNRPAGISQHPFGDGVARENAVQVELFFRLGKAVDGDPLTVTADIHQIVQGIHGRVSGKNGDQTDKGDKGGWEMAQAKQGGQCRRRHVDQPMGGSRQGKERNEPFPVDQMKYF